MCCCSKKRSHTKDNFLNACCKNNLTSNKNSKNFSNKICPDNYACKISCKKSFKIKKQELINFKSKRSKIDYSKCNYNKLVIFILESPHYSEYDKNGEPIGPCMGKTGTNIQNNIENLNLPNELKNTMGKDEYTLTLINAVQFQASQGISPINKNIKDKNWIDFWNKGFKNDLPKRIKFLSKKAKTIVINLCTLSDNGLRFYVNKALRNNKIKYYEGFHPYNWNIASRRTIT